MVGVKLNDVKMKILGNPTKRSDERSDERSDIGLIKGPIEV